MKRLFNEHIKRNIIELSGAWRFLLDPDNIGEDNGWQNGLPDGETVIVPSVWNNELGHLNYEGCGWYEKKFITNGGTLLLQFESVMTTSTVWLDGKKVGAHYGAFTQFEFIVNDINCGEHTLVVRADSRIDKKSFPQRYTDWFNYGGIARDVYAHELKGISILTNHIVYELSTDLKSVTVNAELELYNADASTLSSPVSVKIGEISIYSDDITLDGYERKTVKTPSVTISDIDLWDTDAPNLYTVTAATDTDDLIDKIGFRKIEVKNGDILLNNKSIELLGVNRHEEHPDWGFAFPAKLMKKDIDLICDMGCNTIRGSHYPNSKIFVDMLDEKGILFWSEIPMWGCGFGEEALKDEDVVARGLEMHKEMTKFYYNHPSIIIWGMHNEICTPYPCTYEISKQYNDHLRKNGGNRLITHAANHSFQDSSMEFDDIICLNVYYGWYGGSLSDWDKFVADFGEHIKKEGWENKPVIMSEFGAGALAGFHAHFDTVRWSEEYQRDLLEYCLELFHKTDYMRGTYIWQFCNIRTSPSMDINRVRYFNNKGILDEYRNPKASYFKVKELYHRYSGK
ncbi:MAG: beta-glucuronidase [Clostridia bacterium]|nr:beta-glucuronidase [Clostridia bacterium]